MINEEAAIGHTEDFSLGSSEDGSQQSADHEPVETENDKHETAPKDMSRVRWELVKNLKEKKDSRLTKRLSVETQLLDTAKQELALKRKILERVEELDQRNADEMKMFRESINALTTVIGSGLIVLQQSM